MAFYLADGLAGVKGAAAMAGELGGPSRARSTRIGDQFADFTNQNDRLTEHSRRR